MIDLKKDRWFALHFSISLAIFGLVLNKGFNVTWMSVTLLIACFLQIMPSSIFYLKKSLHYVGILNAMIVMVSAFYLVFTPLGFLYRFFFIAPSFRKSESQFRLPEEDCDFKVPY